MPTLETIQRQYDEFVCAAISAEYNSSWEEPPDLKPIIDKLKEALEEYVKELKDERYRP